MKINVLRPLEGVLLKVQKGRNELVDASGSTKDGAVFDITINVDLGGDRPNFLGPFTQGPKDGRFIYVNSGKMAGQHTHLWSRRAKISLMSILREQVEAVIADSKKCLCVEFEGVGRDGGPSCGTIKGTEWKVIKR